MSEHIIPPISRRDLIVKSGKLSIAGVAVLAGVGTAGFRSALAADEAAAQPAKDVDTLNVVLGLEHQAIGAYQIGVDSGLLKQPALNIALLFQSHHKSHRDALIEAVKKLGGTPAVAQSTAEYAKSLNASSLKVQNDILELALKLELGAANAYIGVLPNFQERDLAKTCGRIIGDEAMHWTALASTLAQPLPANGLFFGA